MGSLDPTDVWNDLVQGNGRFAAGRPAGASLVTSRQDLVRGQHPRAMILACSDSRVPPEIVFDQSLGDLFVVRTAGNVADSVALGSLEYAVAHLHVPLLVVLGHTRCGAVTAVARGEEMPTAGLAALSERIAPAIDGLRKRGVTGDDLVGQGVAANARHSLERVLASSPILGGAVRDGRLLAIPALYRLETGAVECLP